MTQAFDAEDPDSSPPAFILNMAAIDKLAEALAKAQGEMTNAMMNQTNPHFQSRYADLAAIRDATVPALSKHGLAIIQTEEWRDGTPWLVTRLMHMSGQMVVSEHKLPSAVDRPQIFGSALTYARRYCWAAICGIAAEEDDDAEAAEKAPKAVPLRPPRPSVTSGRLPTAAEVRGILKPEPEPPHDKETGEILEPGLLAVPQVNDENGRAVPNWTAWGLNFLNAIKGCSSIQETWQWTDHNATPLEQMKQQAPKVYERLEIAVNKVRSDLATKE